MRWAVVLILSAQTACFPVVPMRTAVEPGLRVGAISALAATTGRRVLSPDSLRAQARVWPMFGGYLSGGREATPGQPGLRLTGYAVLPVTGVDGYVEFPKEHFGDWDAGIGMQLQRGVQRAWGPYLSVGRPISGGRYAWVSQSATALQSPYDSVYRWVAGTMVGLGVRSRTRSYGALFVGAVAGRQDLRCDALATTTCRTATRAYVGATLGDRLDVSRFTDPNRRPPQ